MKNNDMVYFVLALMCIFIGSHFIEFYYRSASAILLIVLGMIIFLILGVKLVLAFVAYSKSQDNELGKEEKVESEENRGI